MSGQIDVCVFDELDGADFGATSPTALADLLSATLASEGVSPPAEVNLVFVDTERIAALNREHMGVDGPTDVLSFPIDGAEKSPGGVPAIAGDIYLAPEIAAKNAPGHAGTLADELALLVVHSGLHLVGYDHAEAEDQAAMWNTERRHIQAFWGALGIDPWN